MKSMTRKVDFLIKSALKRVSGTNMACPNCGCRKFEIEQRKMLIVELRRCNACELMYRAPSDSADENETFYQDEYSEGFTTDVPDDETLAELLNTEFKDTMRSYVPYIEVLRQLTQASDARLFDYGCSWGYGAWQYARAGFEVTSFEISKRRGRYAADKLGVNCIIEQERLASLPDASFDIFVSCHVLEHVPQPKSVLALAERLVRPGGYIVNVTPNGSAHFREASPRGWKQLWGKVHPNLIDDRFWKAVCPAERLHLDTLPVNLESVSRFGRGESRAYEPLTGAELVAIIQVAAS